MATLLLPVLLIFAPQAPQPPLIGLTSPQQGTTSAATVQARSAPARTALLPPRQTGGSKKFAPKPAASLPAQPTGLAKATKVYALRFGAARKVAHAIGQVFKSRFSIDTQRDGVVVESPVLVVPDVRSNRLIVLAEQKYLAVIDTLVQQLDRAPQQVVVRAKLIRTNAKGQRTIIARPQIMVLNGQTGTVKLSEEGGGTLELEVTPLVLPRKETAAQH